MFKAEDSSYWHPAEPAGSGLHPEQQQQRQWAAEQQSAAQQRQATRQRRMGRRMQGAGPSVEALPLVQSFEGEWRVLFYLICSAFCCKCLLFPSDVDCQLVVALLCRVALPPSGLPCLLACTALSFLHHCPACCASLPVTPPPNPVPPRCRQHSCMLPPAERQRTPSTEAAPIDMFSISQGRNISQPGLKAEVSCRRGVGVRFQLGQHAGSAAGVCQ